MKIKCAIMDSDVITIEYCMGVFIHFTCEVSNSSLGRPSCIKGNQQKHLISSRMIHQNQAQVGKCCCAYRLDAYKISR